MNQQIFGVAISARSLAVTAQRRVNCYYDFPKEGEGDRAAISIYGRPGLVLWKNYGANPCRGWRVVPPYLYAAFGNGVYRIDNAGGVTALGLLTTSAGPVYMADNGVQLMVVDDPLGYIFQIFGASAATGQVFGDGLVLIAAGGFLGARHVSYLNNMFITAVPGANPLASQQWQASNPGDGTGWNGLAFDLADAEGDPLLAVWGYQGRACLFGTQSTEFWQDVGATPFAFNRMPATVQGYGLAAVGSIVEFGDMGLAVLARSRRGEAVPAMLTPGGYVELAPADLRTIIAGYATVEDAVGATYEHDGHRFYQLTFPTGGSTWVWDAQTRVWHEATGYTAANPLGRFRGLRSESFLGRTLLSDYADGRLYVLTPGVYDDAGQPLVRELTSGHLFVNDDQVVINEIQFDMEEGVGLAAGQGVDPVALLETSRDKGRTWSAPLEARIGAQGEYGARVIFRRLGAGHNLTLRLRVTDPVKFVLTGEALDMEVGP